jgi:predicted lipid carrier protein YhbT
MIHLNNFQFPSFVKRIGTSLPSPIANAPMMLILEIARRQTWLVAPESLYGKVFQMQVEDCGLTLTFTCEQGKFKAVNNISKPDVCLKANTIDFVKLASGLEDADTLFFRRKLKIEGDTELGIAVKYWIDASERPTWLKNIAIKSVEINYTYTRRNERK